MNGVVYARGESAWAAEPHHVGVVMMYFFSGHYGVTICLSRVDHRTKCVIAPKTTEHGTKKNTFQTSRIGFSVFDYFLFLSFFYAALSLWNKW